jgi:hypothetical protein
MHENSNAEFDWVTALSKCSVNLVFDQLRSQVESDIKARNKSLAEGSPQGFRLGINEASTFSAMLDRPDHHTVTFSLDERRISVKEDGRLMFEVSVTLSDERRCVVRIHDPGRELWQHQVLELWQLRKMALEKLFFWT